MKEIDAATLAFQQKVRGRSCVLCVCKALPQYVPGLSLMPPPCCCDRAQFYSPPLTLSVAQHTVGAVSR